MKKYSLNIEVSRNLYNKHKCKIEPKNCYINIFNISTLYPKTFHSGEWKIAYGYVSSIDNVYCRHCFILAGNEVIDPTVFSTERNNESCRYYIIKVFNSIGEYLDALSEERNFPALVKYLKKEDDKAWEWAQQNGYIFIG